MAVTTSPVSSNISLKLNGGSDPDTGKTITRSVTWSAVQAGIASNATLLGKAYALLTAIGDVLAYPVTGAFVMDKAEVFDE